MALNAYTRKEEWSEFKDPHPYKARKTEQLKQRPKKHNQRNTVSIIILSIIGQEKKETVKLLTKNEKEDVTIDILQTKDNKAII